jgi:hypothetical protein
MYAHAHNTDAKVAFNKNLQMKYLEQSTAKVQWPHIEDDPYAALPRYDALTTVHSVYPHMYISTYV